MTSPNIQLIETLRWTPASGFYLLDLHLHRLRQSADELGFHLDEKQVEEQLNSAAANHNVTGLRVRLLLSANGSIDITTADFTLPKQPITLQCTWATTPVSSDNLLLQHKTTQRQHFDKAFQLAQQQGYDEVLFRNEKGEVTEASRHSIFARFDNHWYTPPLASGLLNGVMRRHLLATRPMLSEKPLTPAQLTQADELQLGNALRGVRPAVIAQA